MERTKPAKIVNQAVNEPPTFDVIIIGGGQSGLATGYYLRRTGLSYVILDGEQKAGGAWQHMWKSLRLFSPAQWSSLPGVIMPGGQDYYPTRDETVNYITQYEAKYQLNVRRPVFVNDVTKDNDLFTLDTSDGPYISKAVINATGIFSNPAIPAIEGLNNFKGEILHSSGYVSPERFAGKRVAVVGEGNSGAQVLAEVSKVAEALWITLKEPSFLPDHVDGRFLFDAASQMYEARKEGKDYRPPSLGQIVMVPTVADARDRGVFKTSYRPFSHLEFDSMVWADGTKEKVDAIIFCTGFKPAIQHLRSLNVVTPDGKAATRETKSTIIDGLWFVGYGNWTGFASATLIGVGRSAKTTTDEVVKYLSVRQSVPTI